jgi:hypothetical protein
VQFPENCYIDKEKIIKPILKKVITKDLVQMVLALPQQLKGLCPLQDVGV